MLYHSQEKKGLVLNKIIYLNAARFAISMEYENFPKQSIGLKV